MPQALIALGSNLGDRAANLRRALDCIAQLPHTALIARSAWHETAPIGGPLGQGRFLNAAALVDTGDSPTALLAALLGVERSLGRVRGERWGPRTIDLDLALYGDAQVQTPELTVPHPRMAIRRFVLAPAAEIAPWLVDPDSGWTVGRLLELLMCGAQRVDVICSDPAQAARLSVALADWLATAAPGHGVGVTSKPHATAARAKLTLAVPPAAGVDSGHWRKMLGLPAHGPVAWVAGADFAAQCREAMTIVAAVWPECAAHLPAP